ncbi:hypothetical protein [Haloplanus pelagicus]|jgi:hypothetical protein|uniref:hypothetical protein n=1 Tax=Haloplanus pelagicus TaxID=2949995 RepID=UPI00203D9AE6|nr:hypothetical protein [Haloplanus sp. HW8-1]
MSTAIPDPVGPPLHVGGLSDAVTAAPVPPWLTVLTGGVLVGASFLVTSLLTDHAAIRAVNAWYARLPTPVSLHRGVAAALSAAGVVTFAAVLVSGAAGSATPTANFAVLVVWVGWWAGYAMSTYLVGNTWPAVNPWRTLARSLPTTGRRVLPRRYGAWPSVGFLLALVWIEVVSPLATVPRALVALILGYTAITLAGARRYGVVTWFRRVDPVSRVFRLYGRVAPVQFDRRIEDPPVVAGVDLRVRLPGAALTDPTTDDPGATAFVVALLWATTFDGLVTTPAWNAFARRLLAPLAPLQLAGRPLVWLFYLLALLVGFAGFLGAYRLAVARSRSVAGSLLAPVAIGRRFAPALLPIAAGYHLAHFLGYFLTLSPALAAALADPFGGGTVQVAVLPAWFGTLQVGVVVAGHLLAVWVAHALAMDLFPGVLRPIRSQYPLVGVMIGYTMTSAWIVGQPTVTPAFL